MKLGTLPLLLGHAPKRDAHARSLMPRSTNHIVGSSPGRFSYICRISRQPGWRIENGKRQLVFSFCLTETALRLDGIDYLARKVLWSLF